MKRAALCAARTGRVPMCPFYVSMTTSLTALEVESSSWGGHCPEQQFCCLHSPPLLSQGKLRGWDCKHRLTLHIAPPNLPFRIRTLFISERPTQPSGCNQQRTQISDLNRQLEQTLIFISSLRQHRLLIT